MVYMRQEMEISQNVLAIFMLATLMVLYYVFLVFLVTMRLGSVQNRRLSEWANDEG